MNKYAQIELNLALGRKLNERYATKDIHQRLANIGQEKNLVVGEVGEPSSSGVNNDEILKNTANISLENPGTISRAGYDRERSLAGSPKHPGLLAPQYATKDKDWDLSTPKISSEHKEVLDTALQKFHPDYGKWYNDIKPKVEGIFKSKEYDDSDFMLGLLASGSKQKHPWDNFKEASRRYAEITHGSSFSYEPESQDTLRVSAGGISSGPKRAAYHANLLGDPEPVTVDRHMKMGVLNNYSDDTAVSAPEHRAITGLTRELATKHNIPPREAQAALWGFHLSRAGLNHPAFHEKGSPLRKYSKLEGGPLEPTDTVSGIQGYGEFMRHNEPALRSLKQSADSARLKHPVLSKMAGQKFLVGHGLVLGSEEHAAMRRGSDLSSEELGQVKQYGTLEGHTLAAVKPEGETPKSRTLDATTVSHGGSPEQPAMPRKPKLEDIQDIFVAMSLIEQLVLKEDYGLIKVLLED